MSEAMIKEIHISIPIEELTKSFIDDFAENIRHNKGNTIVRTTIYDPAQGVNLLYGPGNDPVSVTALAASGAQMILFTTGRGTPVGGPVPTVKISSNKKLAEKKAGWIDFNAGEILRDKNIEELGQHLFEMVLDVAGGRQTANEVNGYRSIAIWKDGVTL